MRLLIISFEFAPNANPRATRWTALAEHWANRGHEVDVICGVPRESDANTESMKNLRVHRVGIGWLAKARQRFGRAAGTPSQPGGSRSSLSRTLARPAIAGMRRVYDLTWKQILWPDYAAGWYRAALKRATKLIPKFNPDAVITVSNPYTAHRVGLALRQRFLAMHWIADIGDPFSIHDQFRANNWLLYRRRNERLERGVLEQADGVTVVTPTMTDTYRRLFPAAAKRIHCVHPLLSNDVIASGEPKPLAKSPRRLSYFGTLYRGIRSPAPLLALFERLAARPNSDDLELHFYGNTNNCTDEFDAVAQWMGSRIHLHGPIPRNEVPDAMRASHILVNLGNDLPYGLPSKTVEYAATGRPILNVAVCREDTAAVFLQGYPAARTVFTEDLRSHPDRVVEETDAFLQNPPTVSHGDITRLLEPHRVESVASQYEQMLPTESLPSRRAA